MYYFYWGFLVSCAAKKSPEQEVNSNESTQPIDLAGVNDGRFVASCWTSHFAQVDPIVNPGQSESGHAHVFFGNHHTDEDSTFWEMQTSPTAKV